MTEEDRLRTQVDECVARAAELVELARLTLNEAFAESYTARAQQWRSRAQRLAGGGAK